VVPWQYNLSMANIEERMIEACLEGIRDVAQQAFAGSQRNVPVRTGRLKRSGRVQFTRDGAVIVYSTPYAADVELGHLRRRVTVAPRLLKATTSLSRGKRIQYAGYTYVQGERRPRYFVGRGVDDAMRSLPRIVAGRLSRA